MVPPSLCPKLSPAACLRVGGLNRFSGLRGKKVGVQIPAEPLPSYKTWASCFISLSLSFVICKVGIMMHLLHRARDTVGVSVSAWHSTG